MDEPASRPPLRVVEGAPGGRLVLADEQVAPFVPDAVVIEQDADLLLAPPRRIVEAPVEHTGRLLLRVLNARRHRPGTVLPGGGRPLQLLAIVHDIECEPSWRREWVAKALAGVFEVSRRRQLQRVAMPLLGTVHGRLPRTEALALLVAALADVDEWPRRVWLHVPSGQIASVRLELGALS